MTFQIDPPLERRHKLGLALMILAGVLGILLVNLALAIEENREAARWQEARHGRR